MRGLLAIGALLLATSGPALAQEDEWPKDTVIEGPVPYCAGGFSLALRDGETLTARDPGLDFMVYYIEGGEDLIGIYQGNYPDVPRQRQKVNFDNGLTFEKFEGEGGSWGYLVNVDPDATLPTYLHFFGSAFGGTEADRLIFDRFLYGDFDHVFCAGPALNHY